MSCSMSIYTEESPSIEEVFDLVKELGGQIEQIGEFSQGVITKDAATIWIYYRGSAIRSKVSIVNQVKTRFNINANTEVLVDIVHDDYSEKLATIFCIHFLEKYPQSVVCYGDCLGLRELKNLCRERCNSRDNLNNNQL